jgi:hypothetical protein
MGEDGMLGEDGIGREGRGGAGEALCGNGHDAPAADGIEGGVVRRIAECTRRWWHEGCVKSLRFC